MISCVVIQFKKNLWAPKLCKQRVALDFISKITIKGRVLARQSHAVTVQAHIKQVGSRGVSRILAL